MRIKFAQSKLILLATATLLLLVSFGMAPTSAITVSNSDEQKIEKECKDKLGKGTSDLELGGCVSGYIMAVGGDNNSACEKAYKNKPAALKACKTTGYNLGKDNPAKVADKKDSTKSKTASEDDKYATHINCEEVTCTDPAVDGKCDSSGCDLVGKYVNPTIRVMSAMVGLLAAISLIYAGIQYSSSGGDPQKIGQAKTRIQKTLFALFFYMFLFAFLNFLIPGGLFP